MNKMYEIIKKKRKKIEWNLKSMIFCDHENPEINDAQILFLEQFTFDWLIDCGYRKDEDHSSTQSLFPAVITSNLRKADTY